MLIIRYGCCLTLFIMSAVFLLSCTPPVLSPGVRENTGSSRMNIRYVNLNILFDYMINSDPDAREISESRKSILKLIEDTRNLISDADETSKKELIIKLEKARSDLDKLKTREESQKERMLIAIDRTLEKIADTMNIDFIFNMGEGAVYAKKEYDITEEALRELINLQKRNAPVAR